MSKAYHHTFTVEGAGTFPIDMLRYDCCHPDRGEDAGAIEEYPQRDRGLSTRRSVQLARITAGRGWQPTAGRWASFGWIVTEHQESAA